MYCDNVLCNIAAILVLQTEIVLGQSPSIEIVISLLFSVGSCAYVNNL